MPVLAALNIARTTRDLAFARRPSGIGKEPIADAVEVREPGPKHSGAGSGLVGDVIGDHRHHGGTDQAVYAFARENLDRWGERFGEHLPSGFFGENLTTSGLDVDGARVGERWRIGRDVVLQVTGPRIPCATFRGWVGRPGWLKDFTADERPGAYLRVVQGGAIRAGDPIAVVHRPAHDVTVALTFRATVRDPALLPSLLAAGDDLPDDLRRTVDSGRTIALDP